MTMSKLSIFAHVVAASQIDLEEGGQFLNEKAQKSDLVTNDDSVIDNTTSQEGKFAKFHAVVKNVKKASSKATGYATQKVRESSTVQTAVEKFKNAKTNVVETPGRVKNATFQKLVNAKTMAVEAPGKLKNATVKKLVNAKTMAVEAPGKLKNATVKKVVGVNQSIRGFLTGLKHQAVDNMHSTADGMSRMVKMEHSHYGRSEHAKIGSFEFTQPMVKLLMGKMDAPLQTRREELSQQGLANWGVDVKTLDAEKLLEFFNEVRAMAACADVELLELLKAAPSNEALNKEALIAGTCSFVTAFTDFKILNQEAKIKESLATISADVQKLSSNVRAVAQEDPTGFEQKVEELLLTALNAEACAGNNAVELLTQLRSFEDFGAFCPKACVVMKVDTKFGQYLGKTGKHLAKIDTELVKRFVSILKLDANNQELTLASLVLKSAAKSTGYKEQSAAVLLPAVLKGSETKKRVFILDQFLMLATELSEGSARKSTPGVKFGSIFKIEKFETKASKSPVLRPLFAKKRSSDLLSSTEEKKEGEIVLKEELASDAESDIKMKKEHSRKNSFESASEFSLNSTVSADALILRPIIHASEDLDQDDLIKKVQKASRFQESNASPYFVMDLMAEAKFVSEPIQTALVVDALSSDPKENDEHSKLGQAIQKQLSNIIPQIIDGVAAAA